MIGRSTTRTDRRLARQLPDVAAEMARLIDSGSTLTSALQMVAGEFMPPAGPQLAALVESLDFGESLDSVLSGWAEDSRRCDVTLLVAACRLGLAEGGNLVVALEGVSVALADSLELSDEAAALTAQARTSAIVLMVLPLMGLTLFSILDRSITAFMFGTPAGWMLLLVGGVLDGLGAAVMTLMVRWSLR